MNKNYINYSDLPEEIQFEDEFKDIAILIRDAI